MSLDKFSSPFSFEKCPSCEEGKVLKMRYIKCESCNGAGLRFDTKKNEYGIVDIKCKTCKGFGSRLVPDYDNCRRCHGFNVIFKDLPK